MTWTVEFRFSLSFYLLAPQGLNQWLQSLLINFAPRQFHSRNSCCTAWEKISPGPCGCPTLLRGWRKPSWPACCRRQSNTIKWAATQHVPNLKFKKICFHWICCLHRFSFQYQTKICFPVPTGWDEKQKRKEGEELQLRCMFTRDVQKCPVTLLISLSNLSIHA